jgi:hypothetical protein
MDPTAIAEILKGITWLAEKFGVAGAVLVVGLVLGCVVFWRVARWLAPRADAIAKSHMKLVDTATETLPQISAAATATVKSMEILVESQTLGKAAGRHLSKAIDALASDDKREQVKVHTENMREALE